MALRNIVKRGDEVLEKRAKEVTEINERILTLMDDMLETMRQENGVGIAAPQVGVRKRIFIVEVEDQLFELINPEIMETHGSQDDYEGCLSVPGYTGKVKRPSYVKIRGLNRKGETVVFEGTDLVARAFCHENDHLDGILFTDKATDIHKLDEKCEEE